MSVAPITISVCTRVAVRPPRVAVRVNFTLCNTTTTDLWFVMPSSIDDHLRREVEAYSFETFAFEENPQCRYLKCHDLYAESGFTAILLAPAASLTVRGFEFMDTDRSPAHHLWTMPEIPLAGGGDLSECSDKPLLISGTVEIQTGHGRLHLGKVKRDVTVILAAQDQWEIPLN